MNLCWTCDFVLEVSAKNLYVDIVFLCTCTMYVVNIKKCILCIITHNLKLNSFNPKFPLQVCTKLHHLKSQNAKSPYRARGDTPLPHPPPLGRSAPSGLVASLPRMSIFFSRVNITPGYYNWIICVHRIILKL